MEREENRNTKITSLEALKFFYNNSALTEYLQTLTDEELNDAYYNIVVDHIDDVKAGILDAIYQEKEYRADARFMSSEVTNKSK